VSALVRDAHAAVGGTPAVAVRLFHATLGHDCIFAPEFVEGVDVLYHCAAELRDERTMEATNVGGTRALARCAAGRIGRWIQVSSAAVYGAVREGAITEDAALRPDSLYGRTKAEAESAAQAAAAGGFELVILRPANVFGPGMPGTALSKLFAAIERGWFAYIGAPGALMNYVPVENVVAAALHCAAHPAAAGRTYNLSEAMPLERLVTIVAEELGRRPPALRVPELPLRVLASALGFVPGHPLTHRHLDALTMRARYASERIQDELGWRPAVSLDLALRELVRAWRHAARRA
jgi:nucleoside-diphosphate-sugar epimerase